MCLVLIGVRVSRALSLFFFGVVGVSGICRLGSGVVDRERRCVSRSGLLDLDLVGSYMKKCCACCDVGVFS